MVKACKSDGSLCLSGQSEGGSPVILLVCTHKRYYDTVVCRPKVWLERTRPGERPPARWTARTVPRFSSMTPPSMHSSSLHILCICGGCTSECQKGATSARERMTHTVTGSSRFHLDALCSDVRRQSSLHDTLCCLTQKSLPRRNRCLGKIAA